MSVENSIADVDGQINIRDNSASIDIEGAEWQAQYRPNNNFLVNANYSYVKSAGQELWIGVLRSLSTADPREHTRRG